MPDFQRLKELAERSYNSGTFTFTDFLSAAELSDYFEKERDLSFATPKLFGGCEIAERKIIRFGNPSELGYDVEFPITALSVEPVAAKFSDDLNHRDFLGALMNLGIKREVLGDIFVKGNRACVFCREEIADYIIENLTRIKHTSVKVSKTNDTKELTAPTLEDKVILLSSARADAVIAKVYNISRNDSVSKFQAGLVYLNGRECTENAKDLKPGDILSVRGLGKFEYSEELGTSKKGKLNSLVRIYS
ncbi:MAG: hypothetical protein K5796_02110 [Lachnospiraceae bacterium]|nr:hypothetical protein [Lachnospiraceae bacterium]